MFDHFFLGRQDIFQESDGFLGLATFLLALQIFHGGLGIMSGDMSSFTDRPILRPAHWESSRYS